MTRYAESLQDIYQHLSGLEETFKKLNKKKKQTLWFRGHAVASYHLEPNIFRKSQYSYNDAKTYSNNHLREDYRFQNFMSRNYDNIDSKMPQFVIEWQEVICCRSSHASKTGA